jgi:hypothetical protein
MRLTEAIMSEIELNRPNSYVIRKGPIVLAAWSEPNEPPASRWKAQVLARTTVGTDGRPCLWWAPQIAERTKTAAVAAAVAAEGGDS